MTRLAIAALMTAFVIFVASLAAAAINRFGLWDGVEFWQIIALVALVEAFLNGQRK
jgi:hypothetical protein